MSGNDGAHLSHHPTMPDRVALASVKPGALRSPLSNDASGFVRIAPRPLPPASYPSSAPFSSLPPVALAVASPGPTKPPASPAAAEDSGSRRRRLKNPGPLPHLAIVHLRNEQNHRGPLSAPPAVLRPAALAPAHTAAAATTPGGSALETVDAAQALLGLMSGSPTTLTPATAPPFGRTPATLLDSPPSPSRSVSPDSGRAKRRKRAVDMTPAELSHARETNKRSAQQFRERERTRRLQIVARGEQMHRANQQLRTEAVSLRALRSDLAKRIRAAPHLLTRLPLSMPATVAVTDAAAAGCASAADPSRLPCGSSAPALANGTVTPDATRAPPVPLLASPAPAPSAVLAIVTATAQALPPPPPPPPPPSSSAESC